jgi:hypothetical protein
MQHSGLFNLQTPRDLLAKAERDFKRLRENPANADAAFDFFVTVRHLPDWLYPSPSDNQQCKELFNNHVELRIARHIADGAKHFKVTQPQHTQVVGTSALLSVPQSGGMPQPGPAQVKDLIIELDMRDPDTAKLGQKVYVMELAERILGVARKIVS